MKDADYVCERLCWMLHDDVVNGRLLEILCIGSWVIHKFCQGLAQVGSGGNSPFEACGMVCRVVESVTLLAVDVVTLCCASGTF